MSIYLRFEADELLAESIMSKTPIIIVEGIDDVQIYEDIILSLNNNIEVYASENLVISEGKSGNNGVKTCLKKISDCSKNIDFTKFIMGIVDRDSSYYRGDDLDIKGLFILNLYSIESHFVNKNNIKYLIEQLTNASRRIINQSKFDEILFNEIKSFLSSLYYISLDALRFECDRDYDATYKYSDNIITITSNDYVSKLKDKIEDLDNFALSKGLSNRFDDLLLLVKGKWLFDYFIYKLIPLIKNLSTRCRALELCQFCKVDNTSNKCSFRLSYSIQKGIVTSMSFKNINIMELEYIKVKIKELRHY